jgi:dihydroneopterin aldolase
MTAMLASVRNLTEARLVAACGVDWIDLKDPARGALGEVDVATISEVSTTLGARFRISATIGDCWETPSVIPARVAASRAAGAAYVKIGAYAHALAPAMLEALDRACRVPAKVIVVCFAEDPPDAEDLARLAATGIVGVMLDTAVKAGPSLRALLSTDALQAFVDRARKLGLLTGLAGRLSLDDIAPLRIHAPDYLGFRGAMCDDAQRTASIDVAKVRALRASIRPFDPDN